MYSNSKSEKQRCFYSEFCVTRQVMTRVRILPFESRVTGSESRVESFDSSLPNSGEKMLVGCLRHKLTDRTFLKVSTVKAFKLYSNFFYFSKFYVLRQWFLNYAPRHTGAPPDHVRCAAKQAKNTVNFLETS